MTQLVKITPLTGMPQALQCNTASSPVIRLSTVFTTALFAFLLSGFVMAAEVVNLNKADAAAMQQNLIGIGPIKAEAIVSYRKKNGKYKGVDDLLNVKGIGPALLKKNKRYLSLSKGAVTGDAKKYAAAKKQAKAKQTGSSSGSSKKAASKSAKTKAKTDKSSKSTSVSKSKESSTNAKKSKPAKASKPAKKSTSKSKTKSKSKKTKKKCDPKKDKNCKAKAKKPKKKAPTT